jgi:hypothetical protein
VAQKIFKLFEKELLFGLQWNPYQLHRKYLSTCIRRSIQFGCSVTQKNIFGFGRQKLIFFIHIILPLEVADDDTVEFVKSTEWPMNSTDLIPLDYHVSNECVQLVYKTKENHFGPWNYGKK